MKNTVIGANFGNYPILAALCSFRLLFRRRIGVALLFTERVLTFERSSLRLHGWAFPCGFDSPKPGLPRGAGANFRLAYFGRGSGAGLVVSSQVPGLDPDILCKRRNSYTRSGHSPDHHLPWRRSNPAGS